MKSREESVVPRQSSEAEHRPHDDQKNAGGTNSPAAFWMFVGLAIAATIVLGFVLS